MDKKNEYDKNKKYMVVVLGYGCHLTPQMINYLNSVVDFVHHYAVSCIILTGGFTNKKTAQGVAECSMMCRYLYKSEFKLDCSFELDYDALTTTENIEFVERAVKWHKGEFDEIVIFCDSCRSLKVRLLARAILGFWPKIKECDITQNFWLKLRQVLFATPIELLALRSEYLTHKKMEMRKKLIDCS